MKRSVDPNHEPHIPKKWDKLLTADKKQFQPSKHLKEAIRSHPRFQEATHEVNRSSIIPFLTQFSGYWAKAAVIALLIGSGLLSFHLSENNRQWMKHTPPQLVDTSLHGFDTSYVKQRAIQLR